MQRDFVHFVFVFWSGGRGEGCFFGRGLGDYREDFPHPLIPTGKLRVVGLGVQGSTVGDLVMRIAGLRGATLVPGVRNEWRAFGIMDGRFKFGRFPAWKGH